MTKPWHDQRLRTLLGDCLDPSVQVTGEAADAVSAMTVLQHRPCDVLLLDIHMPGTTGLQLARAVRQLPSPPLVVFVTAHAVSKRQNKYTITENKKEKTTTIDIILSSFVPVSEVSIYSDKKIEFYRPFELKALRDSTKLASGSWTYHYGNIKSGTLSSLDDNRFSFNNTWTKKLSHIIHNNDNAPVNIDSIRVSGPDYYLIGRFDNKQYSILPSIW